MYECMHALHIHLQKEGKQMCIRQHGLTSSSQPRNVPNSNCRTAIQELHGEIQAQR